LVEQAVATKSSTTNDMKVNRRIPLFSIIFFIKAFFMLSFFEFIYGIISLENQATGNLVCTEIKLLRLII